MARAPNEKQVKAEELFKKGYKLIDISKELDIPEGTIRSWKNRCNWDNENNATLQKKENKKRNVANKKNTIKSSESDRLEQVSCNKDNVTYKTRSCPNNARPGNKNAETHGFFSKFLPEDTLEVIQKMKGISELEIIWGNITIQYAAIIRSQKIMFVKDKEEMIKELKKTKDSWGKTGSSEEREYEFQFAWDRQATFLNAQSRAMSELRSLIKQYDEMLHKNWDLATEEQKSRISKLKLEIENARGDGKDDKAKSWAEAIQEIAAKRRGKDG